MNALRGFLTVLRLPVAMCLSAAILIAPGCTTVATQKRVLEEPLSADTEQRVLKETGISGAIVGSIAGGVVAGGVTLLIAKASGMSNQDALITAGAAGVAGAVAGGVIGYQKGKEQGQKIVARSMERDQLAKLLKGARAYNARLERVNDSLRTQVREVKRMANPKMKKQEYAQLLKLAKREDTDASKRITEREKALENPKWRSSDKPAYKETLQDLKSEKKQLGTLIGQIEKSQQTAAL